MEEDILDRLGKLPVGLKAAYDDIRKTMSSVNRRFADRAFQWVMCIEEPPRTTLLLAAVCQDKDGETLTPLGGLNEELLLKYCHNLLVIDPVRKIWVPSHLSVVEYFENHLWNHSQANSLVANVCLLVLQNTVLGNREQDWLEDRIVGESSDDTRLNSEDPLSQPNFRKLSQYARDYWPVHIRRNDGTDTRMSRRLYDFLGLPTDSSPAYRCWHRMAQKESLLISTQRDLYTKDLSPATVAAFAYCAFGLAKILPHWYKSDWVREDLKSEEKKTFLELAVGSRSLTTCRQIVESGADVNAISGSFYGSPLFAAALRNNQAMVEFLVKKGGADVNQQLNNGNYGSALATATWGGYQEIVEFLVKEGGADVNQQLQYGRYGSVLASATCVGDQGIVKILVGIGGADVNQQLQYGRYGSALATAAALGHQRTVEYLVKEGGAEVNQQLKYGGYGSALAAATTGGYQETVGFLLQEGAEVNMQLQYGDYGSALAAATGTAAAVAAPYQSREIVELLLQEGAEVNMQLQYGEYSNALELAEELQADPEGRHNADKVVELLIKYGAKRVEPRDRVVEVEKSNE